MRKLAEKEPWRHIPSNFRPLVKEDGLYGSNLPVLESQIDGLKRIKNIKAIVSLEAPSESIIKKIREAKIEHLVEEIPDSGAPGYHQLERILEFIKKHVSKGNRVMVHCQKGEGRTGMVHCAYLVEKGVDEHKALRQITVESPEQWEFVSEYPKIRKMK
ncbi:dual specificity protein phosphatase family protein [Candidatus Micrarchaeota archaeon]|nr:dual specificity protein phosphatase family protein [Candidatus Micrarchaeota archaeon]